VTRSHDDPSSETVEAAGGVLWRSGPQGAEFAVIHRPKYDDWTLPKGKLDPGEDHEEAALREVAEETGYRAELGGRLGDVHYEAKGSPKRVRYWGMRALDGRFRANSEVDDMRWLPVDRARALLTYERDRDVLDEFLARPTADDAGRS
jgi:8-oxo-dGTP diphosphatase